MWFILPGIFYTYLKGKVLKLKYDSAQVITSKPKTPSSVCFKGRAGLLALVNFFGCAEVTLIKGTGSIQGRGDDPRISLAILLKI